MQNFRITHRVYISRNCIDSTTAVSISPDHKMYGVVSCEFECNITFSCGHNSLLAGKGIMNSVFLVAYIVVPKFHKQNSKFQV